MKCFYLHMLTECSTELLKGTERNFVNITEMFYTWHQYEHTLAAKLMSNWKIFLFVVWKQNKFTYFLLLPPHNMLHCDNWTETANPCAAYTKKARKKIQIIMVTEEKKTWPRPSRVIYSFDPSVVVRQPNFYTSYKPKA